MKNFLILAFSYTACCNANPVWADTAPLIDNQVIVDNAPFFSVGGEDVLGIRNYALNNDRFIDIPYAIFDFGSVQAVSHARLQWNFLRLFGGSEPAEITLYVGSDTDGTIATADRFVGDPIDTTTYSGGEVRSFDVTAQVNAALVNGQYFAARLEATAPPSSLSNPRVYSGGQFLTPTLEFTAIPEPGTLSLVGMALAGLCWVGANRNLRKSQWSSR